MLKKTLPTLLFICFSIFLFGQVGLQVQSSDYSPTTNKDLKLNKTPVGIFFPKYNTDRLPVDLKEYVLGNPSSTNSFSTKNTKTELAFFCRIEVQLEKSTNIPVRFRLGEVQAVDKKEGKWKQFQQ